MKTLWWRFPLTLWACLLALASGSGPAQAAEIPAHPRLFEMRTFKGPSGTVEAFEDPCGVGVDAAGSIYVADYYRDRVLGFATSGGVLQGSPAQASLRLSSEEPGNGPCALAVSAAGRFDVNGYHASVKSFGGGDVFDAGNLPITSPALRPTGVAEDRATGRIYVDDRTYIAEYEGTTLLRRIGLGILQDGYGLAVSDYPAANGYLYAADAKTGTIKVFDPSASPELVKEIDGEATAEGGFNDLTDAALAVNSIDGHLFLIHAEGPLYEHPEAFLDEFNAQGDYRGRVLARELIAGSPSGLAVAPRGTAAAGDLYVTSGNGEGGKLFGLAPTGTGYTLQVSKAGGGAGTVSSEPAGIHCGGACTAEFNSGATVTLTALAAPGSAFREWSGACSGSSATCQVAIGGDREVSAAFEPAPGAAASAGAQPNSAPGTAGFGFKPSVEGFQVTPVAEGGGPDTAAGAHPYELDTKFALNLAPPNASQPGSYTEGDIRDLKLELPPGLIGNPDAVPKCRSTEFTTPRESPFETSASGESCPAQTQIGVATIHTSAAGGKTRSFGIFNLAPPPGVPAAFGIAPYGVPLLFYGQADTNAAGEYTLTLEAHNIHQQLDLYSLDLTIWGVPWGVSHDGQRGNCLNEVEPGFPWAKCSAGALQNAVVPFLSLPTYCGTPLAFTVTADSWQDPTPVIRAYDGPALEACETVPFDPQAVGQITNPRASSPSGFEFVLTNNNEGLLGPLLRAPSQAKSAVVSLPEGVTINPSLGAGLGVCTPAQFAAETATSPQGAGCPNDSKIGELTVQSPLFEERIGGESGGAVYLAASRQNPFGTLLAVYLIARAPARGVFVKLAGKLVPDPQSGRLTVTFEDLPQIPYTNLEVHFREGQRAPLVSPPGCGTFFTDSTLTPWLGQLGDFHRKSYSTIEQGIGGGPCPAGEAPFKPEAKGGTLNRVAGAYSPFYLHLTRTDAQKEITTYSTALPPGLLGKIAGIPYCPQADIEAARHNGGEAELEHPSCPPGSQIGRTSAGYGVGPALTYALGKLYLAGPYHGAPLSIVAVDPALVGPFDLGVVVVRSAIRINPFTAQVSIDSSGSDPIPHIIEGVPLHLRDIRIYLDRPQFMLNPTSCEPFGLTSIMTGSAAPFTNPVQTSATVVNRFQAAECDALGFRPNLSLRLLGGTHVNAFPKLRAELRERPGDANIKDAAVALPHAEFLAQEHIVTICTRRQFAADACPPGSVYGHARAFSPLLSEPLEGPVLLRSGTHLLPDMVVALRGDGGIAIDLEGHIDQVRGGMRATFENLPDGTASKFVLTLFGGKRGLLANSANTCRTHPSAAVSFVGQNNAGYSALAPLKSRCRKHHRRRHHRGTHRHKHKGGRRSSR